MKYFICSIFFFCLFSTYSQNLQLIDTTDYDERKLLISQFEEKNEVFNKQIKASYKGKLRNEVLKFYKESQNSLIELVENKKFLFQERFQKFTDSLFNTLTTKNPYLKDKNIKLFLTKNPSPNAFSIGNGTIVINIGLFSLLENEQQLLGVMAHEVAHEVLEHTRKSIEKKAKLNTSVLANNSGFSRSLKIQKYNRGSKSFEMLKELLYENGEKQRKNEIEADSLGYLLYKNTNFEKKAFKNALVSLRKYDSIPAIELDSTIYKKIFNLPKQPFKKDWIKHEDFGAYNYEHYKEKIDLDSLKAHPEIQERIIKLQSNFPELKNESDSFLIASNMFSSLKDIANIAYVENLHYVNEYGLSLYLILKRMEKNANDPYLQKWLSINFIEIYNAKKKYLLNRYVDRVVPSEQSKSYQQFLNFIWNLNLDEIKTIADYYEKITNSN